MTLILRSWDQANPRIGFSDPKNISILNEKLYLVTYKTPTHNFQVGLTSELEISRKLSHIAPAILNLIFLVAESCSETSLTLTPAFLSYLNEKN